MAGESAKYETARTNAKAGAAAKPKGIKGLEDAVGTAITNFNKENDKLIDTMVKGKLTAGTLKKALDDANAEVKKETAEYKKLQ